MKYISTRGEQLRVSSQLKLPQKLALKIDYQLSGYLSIMERITTVAVLACVLTLIESSTGSAGHSHDLTARVTALEQQVSQMVTEEELDSQLTKIKDECCSSPESEVYVSTRFGKIKGLSYHYSDDERCDVFYGIPYSKPPTGEHRFAPPRPIPAWFPEVKDATKYGNICLQQHADIYRLAPASEDCLNLNIYAPRPRLCVRPLPVMMFIHGGKYRDWGSPYFNYTNLALKGVIVVTINYRLDGFGFLSTEDSIVPGNFGLMDARLALEFVKEIVGDFGGDAGDITLFGVSSGSAMVTQMSLSPLTRGKFQKAIMQSGPGTLNAACYTAGTPFVPRQIAFLLAQKMNCSLPNGTSGKQASRDLLECLRNVTAEDLVGGIKDLTVGLRNVVSEDLVGGIKDLTLGLRNVITDDLVGGIKDLTVGLRNVVSEGLVGGIKDLTAGLRNVVSEGLVGGIKDLTVGLSNVVSEDLIGGIKDLTVGLRYVISNGLVGGIKDLTDLVGGIKDITVGLRNVISNDLVGGIKDLMVGLRNVVTDHLVGGIKDITVGLRNVITDDLVGDIKDITVGLRNVITDDLVGGIKDLTVGLRNVTSEDFVGGIKDLTMNDFQSAIIFVPVSGDHFGFLPEHPSVLANKTSDIVSIPVVLGWTADDSSWYVPDPDDNGLTFEEFASFVQSYISISYTPAEAGPLYQRVLRQYNISASSNLTTLDIRSVAAQLITDATVRSFTVKQARHFSRAAVGSEAKVFVYEYRHRPSYSTNPTWQGTTHMDDEGMCLGLPHGPKPKTYPKTSVHDREASEMMTTMWSNFAKYGQPSPIWPQFGHTADDQKMLLIRPSPGVVQFDSNESVELWTGSSGLDD
ncbi:carboxylic ester hydrolase [Elysia marginata]|uniref:Carboxylic ester hydrolase n=1 Tax=Elysia marginata TaxID=1093978 RepID=A0AAV4EJY8_9GAST|nr:carboxylic ester hydrolase [Elysia marginata]